MIASPSLLLLSLLLPQALLVQATAEPPPQAATETPEADPSTSDTQVAEVSPAPDRAPLYEYRDEHDRYGTGKFYMDREIARVMSFHGIPWLERPEREREEKLSDLLELLDVQPGMTVADIGAGSGVITLKLAEAVGQQGLVYAVDIQPEMLAVLGEKIEEKSLTNIRPVLGTTKTPKLPDGSVDLAIMVDVYHEFDFPHEMLTAMAASLKPGGRIAWVEYRKEDPRIPILEVHKMSLEQVKREASRPEFGLEFAGTRDDLPRQHVIFFRRPADE